ncbi:hypothetical protein CASFOL_006821 [Castilleja foliolosa]|uniref:F-box domain-containing protein n=1 Tax=Castilleja foliolosa TaxID=1961234 RepID=A0ABD3E7V3_9LAMI
MKHGIYSDYSLIDIPIYFLSSIQLLEIFMVKLLNMNDDDDDPTEKPSSSAQIVASIDDLLIQIIHCLRLKPVVQFRLVSKYWNSLILNPKLCLSCNRPAVGLIFDGLYKGPGISKTSYIFFLDKSTCSPFRMLHPFTDPWYRDCKILQSCNGLLLCVKKRACPKYYVCNPTTRKYIELPEVVFDHSRQSIHGMYLAFDPSKSPHYYKVVCVLRCLRGWLISFEVYSSETGSWRKGGQIFKEITHFDFEDGVYWNGAIHWYPRCVYLNLDCDETETREFPRPQRKGYDKNDYYFGESGDHLHFVDAYKTVSEFIVYEMRRDYSEWFVKYKVNIPEMKTDHYEWIIQYKDIVSDSSRRCAVVVRGKDDKDWFLVIAIGKRIIWYNFGMKTCETLYDFGSTVEGGSVYWGRKCPFQYIESLNSV